MDGERLVGPPGPNPAGDPREAGVKATSGRARGKFLAPVGQALATAAAVIILTFVMVRAIPGDPVVALTGSRSSEQVRAELRHELHLDESLPAQFGLYLEDLAHGDLGQSLVQGQKSVASVIADSLPVTGVLVLVTALISCLVGLPLGLLAGSRETRWLDGPIRTLLTVLLATPPFLCGLVLILLVSLDLGWLPAGGWPDSWPQNFEYLLLPALALAAYLTPLIARATRQACIDSLAEPWAEAAVARGMPSGRLARTLVLRRCAVPVVTVLAFNLGVLVSGAVVVEAVFGLPGIGTELVNAIRFRDYPVVQGIALVSALAVIFCNLAADYAVELLDPRARR